MLNSENTIKINAITSSYSILHILSEVLTIQSYDMTQHDIILDLDLVYFTINSNCINSKKFRMRTQRAQLFLKSQK